MTAFSSQPDSSTGKDAGLRLDTGANFSPDNDTVTFGNVSANARRAFVIMDISSIPQTDVCTGFQLSLAFTVGAGQSAEIIIKDGDAAALAETAAVADIGSHWATAAAFTIPTIDVDPIVVDIDVNAQVQRGVDAGWDAILFEVKYATEPGTGTVRVVTCENADAGLRPLLAGTHAPPVAPFDSATIHTDGETAYLDFDNPAGGWDTPAFVGDETDVVFTVTRNGSPVIVTGVAASGTVGVAGFTEVSVDLSAPIYSGETVTVTFPAGLIEDADGRTSEGGTGESVTNGSEEEAPAGGMSSGAQTVLQTIVL